MTPAKTDLTTLNICSEVVRKALQTSVLNHEANALDAGKRGEYHSAELYKQWAFATELASHAASNALYALFIESQERGDFELPPHLRLLERTVFPTVSRTEEDCRLDDLQMEVASAQEEPSPEPA
jgi:hypothetical protein